MCNYKKMIRIATALLCALWLKHVRKVIMHNSLLNTHFDLHLITIGGLSYHILIIGTSTKSDLLIPEGGTMHFSSFARSGVLDER